MTSGLVKERKTIFINGYAVQLFTNIFKNTKIMIYVCVSSNTYICMTEITLDYIADVFSVDQVELSLVNETIDLINRQKAEIERLRKEMVGDEE